MADPEHMHDALRPHEISVDLPDPQDAQLRFIGRIETPWASRKDCPRQGRHEGPECRIVLFEPWDSALKGLEAFEIVEVLYWLDHARRDLLLQNPKHDGTIYGTFALRSPVRPNPIGTSRVRLVAIEGNILRVRGLDCLDGTPLIDLKPDRCAYSPQAGPKDGVDS